MPNIVVISPGYNCSQWLPKLVDSLKIQTVENFRCFLVDDMSTDSTYETMLELTNGDDRFTVIKNEKKLYSAGAHYTILHGDYGINDQDICITIDADDWLPDANVFARVLGYYSIKNVWMTSGSFIQWRGTQRGYGAYVANDFINRCMNNAKNFDVNFRHEWFLSHLRTFKVFLFRRIAPQDLIDPRTKTFWKSAGDVAMMCPMAEMAGLERMKLIVSDINYVYNVATELNLHKLEKKTQSDNFMRISRMRRYRKIR